jgi:hypothetical protein
MDMVCRPTADEIKRPEQIDKRLYAEPTLAGKTVLIAPVST